MQLEIMALHGEEPVAILFQHHRFRLPHYGMDRGEIRGAVEVRSRRGPCVSCFSRSLEVLCRAVKVFVHVWNRRLVHTCAFPRCICRSRAWCTHGFSNTPYSLIGKIYAILDLRCIFSMFVRVGSQNLV